MENQLINYFISQGAWACLFVWLLINTRKESKERETNLQNIIKENQSLLSNFVEQLKVLDNIQEDVKDIKKIINAP